MKVKLTVSNALLNEETGRRGGLYETHDVPAGRGDYLCSIGAAVAVEDGEDEAPSGNATVTAPSEQPKRQPVPVTARKAAPAPAPTPKDKK